MHKSAKQPRRRSASTGPSKAARDRVMAEFDARGITIREWARLNGVKESAAYQVLNGKNKGRRGEAHRAAVLLGLKAGVVEGKQGEVEDGSV